jgi:hypothetical protein
LNYSGFGATATAAYFSNDSTGYVSSKGTVLGTTYTTGPLTGKLLGVSEYTSGTWDALNTIGAGGSYAIAPKTVADFGIYQEKDSKANYKMNTVAVGVQQEMFKGLKVYGQIANTQNKGTSTPSYKGNYNFTSYIPADSSNGSSGAAASLPSSLGTGQTAQSINFGLLYAFF